MKSASVDFAEYSKAAVKRFLRTAVLIDDEIQVVNAESSGPTEEVVAPPFSATTIAGSWCRVGGASHYKRRADCERPGGGT